jgi:predicted dehydrogenase
MQKIGMLGSGFIGRFYAEAIHGQRSKDVVVAVYARKEESAKKFAKDYDCTVWSTNMEEIISTRASI